MHELHPPDGIQRLTPEQALEDLLGVIVVQRAIMPCDVLEETVLSGYLARGRY